jgi:hypothetical protein
MFFSVFGGRVAGDGIGITHLNFLYRIKLHKKLFSAFTIARRHRQTKPIIYLKICVRDFFSFCSFLVS